MFQIVNLPFYFQVESENLEVLKARISCFMLILLYSAKLGYY